MRNIRKPIIRIALTVALALTASLSYAAQPLNGEMAAGGKLGYVSENSSVSLSAFYHITFSQYFRLSPEIGYTFRNKNEDAFTLDINAHIPFAFTGDNVSFYPLAGLNFSSWDCRFSHPDYGSSSKRYNRFGLNVGAGFALRCSSRIKMLVEAKYCIIKNLSSAQIAACISYTL